MTQACQLCGRDEFETVSEKDRHGKPLRTVLCLGCGGVTNDPIPTDAELDAFYRSDYRSDYKGVAEPRMRQILRNFGRMERHMATDAGFYRGRRRCLDLGGELRRDAELLLDARDALAQQVTVRVQELDDSSRHGAFPSRHGWSRPSIGRRIRWPAC